jgi:hypothetical protein
MEIDMANSTQSQRIAFSVLAAVTLTFVAGSTASANNSASSADEPAPLLVDTFLQCYEWEEDCSAALPDWERAYPGYNFYCENYFTCTNNGGANALFYAPE